MIHILEKRAGERAWKAADRACGADGLVGSAHYAAIKAGVAVPEPVWAEIDEEAMMDALEVLPPRYFPGGFAVSEAVMDGADGRTLYLCIVTVRGRHFARYAVPSKTLRDEVAA